MPDATSLSHPLSSPPGLTPESTTRHHHSLVHNIIHLGHLASGWFLGTVSGFLSMGVVVLLGQSEPWGAPVSLSEGGLRGETFVGAVTQAPIWILGALVAAALVALILHGAGWVQKAGHFFVSIVFYWLLSGITLVLGPENSLPEMTLFALSGFLLVPSLVAAVIWGAYAMRGSEYRLDWERYPRLVIGISAALAPFLYLAQFWMLLAAQNL